MERYERENQLVGQITDLQRQLRDAQATVEALTKERDKAVTRCAHLDILLRDEYLPKLDVEAVKRSIADRDHRIDELEREIEQLDDTVEALQAQIASAKHRCRCYTNWWDGKTPDEPPYETLLAQVEALQRERDGLEQNCLNNHVTIEQADAKVMKLEGERGMWATERIDLLTQLENAEFALDAEREKVKAHERAYQEGHPSPCTLGSLCPYCEIERRVEQLSQLQALVRALPSFHVVCSQQKWYLRISGYFCSISEDEAMAWNRFMQYRATLDATTPVGGGQDEQ